MGRHKEVRPEAGENEAHPRPCQDQEKRPPKGMMIMAEKAIEKVYTIPLRGWMKEPRSKRSKRAVREVQAFVAKHTKSKIVKISKGVNELIFSRGFQKPPRRIKVEVNGDKETVQVRLPGESLQEKTDKKSFAKSIKDRLGGKAKDAKKKELKELDLAGTGLSAADVKNKVEIIKYLPLEERKAGKIIEGEPEEAAAKLAKLLREEAKVI